MQKIAYIKAILAFLIVLTISSCGIKIAPPVMPDRTLPSETPIITEIFKNQVSDPKKELTKQSTFKIASNWQEIKKTLDAAIIESQQVDHITLPIYDNFIKSKNNAKQISSSGKITNDFNKKDVNSVFTNGAYLYIIKEKRVLIFNTSQNNNISFESGINLNETPSGLFATDNHLAIFGKSTYKNNNSISNKFSFIKIFDTKSKNKPQEIFNLQVEGDMLDMGVINEKLIFLSSTSLPLDNNRKSLLPKTLNNEVEINCSSNNPCDFPTFYFLDTTYTAPKYLMIGHMNLNEFDKNIATNFFLLPSSYNYFLGNDLLTISYEKNISKNWLQIQALEDVLQNKLSEKEKEKTLMIKSIDSSILSDFEKNLKVNETYNFFLNSIKDDEKKAIEANYETTLNIKFNELYDEINKTVFHKISFAKDALQISNKVELSGFLNSGEMMSATDSDIYISTNSIMPITVENNKYRHTIFSLDQKFNIKGKSESVESDTVFSRLDLLDQSIFLFDSLSGNQALHFDIKKSTEPKFSNKIKLSSASKIILPISDISFLLINNTESSTLSPNLRLTLHDLTDKENPIETSSFTFGSSGTNSEIFKDIKRGLYSYEKKILAIPVTNTNLSNNIFGNQEFDGLALFSIDFNSIKLRGLIDHSDFKDNNTANTNIFRIFHEGDAIFSVSGAGLKSNSIKGVNQLGKIQFSSL